jgi:hypothetical protein
MKHFDVRDPHGFIHRVGVDSAGVHGTNNFGHHYDLLMLGRYKASQQLMNAIVTALVRGDPLPQGYTAKEVKP